MADPQVFRLGQRGLARVLGKLEARLMEALWDSPKELSVQEICQTLGPRSNYKTVMTVLSRLVGKGLLARHLKGRAYFYRSQVEREVFLKSVADGVIQGLLQDYGDVAVARFIDVLETVSPDSLARLEWLLRERQKRRPLSPEDERGAGAKGR